MYGAFAKLLNMSLTAGILTLAIIPVRGFMKKAPRRYVCILWAIVAVRLVCPVSVESSFSFFNLLPVGNHAEGAAEIFRYSGENGQPEIHIDVPVLSGEETARDGRIAADHTADFYLPALIAVWVAGSSVMLLWALISHLRLKRLTAASIRKSDNIYVCEAIHSPFILGVIRPRIFLPSGLAEEIKSHVIAHERAHIRRLDHWWKPAGFLLLAAYWFNPVLWLAYVLFCRDIEAACDEKVIEELSRDGRVGYAEALLSCAVHRRMVTACPLAFGENDVKGRVKNALHYRKPAFWVLAAAAIVCCVVGVSFLTDPKGSGAETAEAVQAGDASSLSALREAEEEALRAEEARQLAIYQAEMEARKAAEKAALQAELAAACAAEEAVMREEYRAGGYDVQSFIRYTPNEDGSFTTENGKTYAKMMSVVGVDSETGDDYLALILTKTKDDVFEEVMDAIERSLRGSTPEQDEIMVSMLGTRPHVELLELSSGELAEVSAASGSVPEARPEAGSSEGVKP